MNKKLILFSFFISLLGFIIFYFWISLTFNGQKLLPNTYINGINCGNMTIEKTEEILKRQAKAGEITLEKNDGTKEKVDLSALSYKAELEKSLDPILYSQNSLLWGITLFEKNFYEINLKLTYDPKGIKDMVESLKCVTSQKASPPQNAYIEKTESGYKIIPETEGSLIDKEMLALAIEDAVSNHYDSINLSEAGCYQKAEITTESESIKNIAAIIDKFDEMTISYDFDDRQEILTSEEIRKWITIEEDEILVDEEKAKQYITNLAYKYDTYQKERKFKTTAGKEITVSGGIYGWQTDIDKSTKELIDTIKQGESATLTPVYKISGFCRKENDIGNTYVEVSIEKQHMWYYIDGELIVDMDIVTGLPNGSRDTPKGVFCIWSKERNTYLGTIEKQGYSSFVKYWMPIDWTGVGIHDASWRNSFGGSIYKNNGSHGCINSPEEKVKIIFDKCTTGTPVIVY